MNREAHPLAGGKPECPSSELCQASLKKRETSRFFVNKNNSLSLIPKYIVESNKSCDNTRIHLTYKGGRWNWILKHQNNRGTIWSSKLKSFVILVTFALKCGAGLASTMRFWQLALNQIQKWARIPRDRSFCISSIAVSTLLPGSILPFGFSSPQPKFWKSS